MQKETESAKSDLEKQKQEFKEKQESEIENFKKIVKNLEQELVSKSDKITKLEKAKEELQNEIRFEKERQEQKIMQL